MQNEQGQPSDNAARIVAAATLFLLRTFAVPLDVIAHRGHGERYLGLQAVAAALLIPLFGAFFPGHDLRPLLGFLGIYLVMCVVARCGIGRSKRTTGPVHSYFSGTPRLRSIVGWRELTIRQYVEPLIGFLGGSLIVQLSPPLGVFLMLASFSQCALVSSAEAFERTRARSLSDSLIEQRQMAERLRR